MSHSHQAQFANQKYFNLESYGARGRAVRTPLWFVEHDTVLYFYTESDSHKVKRLRNNPRVRIAPCDRRGDVTGEWVEATARLVEGSEAQHADDLLNHKYGLLKRAINLVNRLRGHQRTAFAVRLD